MLGIVLLGPLTVKSREMYAEPGARVYLRLLGNLAVAVPLRGLEWTCLFEIAKFHKDCQRKSDIELDR